jgi:predicted acetyltransferase
MSAPTASQPSAHASGGGLTVRPVDLDSPELDAYIENVRLVFKDASAPTPDRAEHRREVYRTQRVTAAFEGSRVVGTYRSWDTGVTVPGGARVQADAVSTVTVRPTHRRRGVLTRMMTADLRAVADAGLPAAVLIAAEAPIYGRFGFGPATETARWRVDLRAARIAPGVPREGTVEIVPEASLIDVAPDVFARARQPGAIDIHDHWWAIDLGIRTFSGDPRKPRTAAVHRDRSGVPQGYVRWRAEEKWEDRDIRTTVHVETLYAATAQAYAALWGLLTELDLAATVEAEERAVDEPLPWLLTDSRAARQAARCDFQWARLLDVPVALSARTYEVPGAVAVEVVDPMGFAGGRYVLEADATGRGACTRTDREPDVRLPVDVLSSLWLGGGDLRAAAIAGRAVEEVPGGLARLASLLRTASAPWTPIWF